MQVTVNGIPISSHSLMHPLFDTIPKHVLFPFSTDISKILAFTKTHYFNFVEMIFSIFRKIKFHNKLLRRQYLGSIVI